MTGEPATNRPSAPLRSAALAVLVATLFLTGLGYRRLWNPVEPRYAGICEEIRRDGNVLVPTYAGAPYDQKPPLYFWIGAVLLGFGESDEARQFLVRLPSAAGALLLALAAFTIGRRMFSPRAGLLAALMTATMWLVFWSSRFCHIDTAMAAAIVWTTWWMHRAAVAPDGRGWNIARAALAAATGTMLKGILALLFPIAAIAASALVLGGGAAAVVGRIRRSGALIVVLTAVVAFLAWWVPAFRSGGKDWSEELLLREGFLHLVDRDEVDKHGVGYYLGVFWTAAAPWSLLVPALIPGLRRGEDRRQAFMLLAWTVVFAVLLSFGASRRSRYLMPLLPLVAVLLGRLLDVHWEDARRTGAATARLMRLGFVAAGALATALGLGLAAPRTLGPRLFGDAATRWAEAIATVSPAIGAAAIILGAAAVLAALRDRIPNAFAAVFGAVLVLGLSWNLAIGPRIDRERGDDRLIEAVRTHLARGFEPFILGHYGERESTPGFYGFYFHRRFPVVPARRADTDALLSAPRVLLLVPTKEAARSPGVLAPGWGFESAPVLGFHRMHLLARPERLNDRAAPPR